MQKIHYEIFGYILDLLQWKGFCRLRTRILNTKQHLLDLNQTIIKIQNYTTLILIKPFQKCKTTRIWYEASHLRNTKPHGLDLNQAILELHKTGNVRITWGAFMKPLWQWRSIIFIWNIPVGVTIIGSINIFNHNQQTHCEQSYYVATTFDRELGSSSGHDKRILKYTETKYDMLVIYTSYIKNTLKCMKRNKGNGFTFHDHQSYESKLVATW